MSVCLERVIAIAAAGRQCSAYSNPGVEFKSSARRSRESRLQGHKALPYIAAKLAVNAPTFQKHHILESEYGQHLHGCKKG